MVEGAHAVRDLLTRYPEQILTIVTAYGYLPKERQSDRLVRLASSTQQYSCPDLQFSKLSDLDAPQGILAVVRQPTWDEGEVLEPADCLGDFWRAATRSCQCWGHYSNGGSSQCERPVAHAGIRRCLSSQGGSCNERGVARAADLCRQGCVWVDSARLPDLCGRSDRGRDCFDRRDSSGADGNCVLAVGNESRGLSAQIRKQATTRFTIPLSRDVESLNVAATVAIATFYFSRLPKGE